MCLNRCLHVDLLHRCYITKWSWNILTLLLILYTTGALVYVGEHCTDYLEVWNRDEEDCLPKHTPMLLSRALTSDPFRGVTVALGLICAYLYSMTPNISPARAPIVLTLTLIAIAFVVSMFHTSAHSELIGAASLVGLIFTCPIWHSIHDEWLAEYDGMFENTADQWAHFLQHVYTNMGETLHKHDEYFLWTLFWGWTVLMGGTTVIMLWGVIKTMRSWLFIFEYLFFWSLFFLCGFTIKEANRENDQRVSAQSKQTTESSS